MADTTIRKRTLAPWIGLLLTLLGVLSNWLPFIGVPAARVPWISLLLSLIGFVVVLLGLWRGFCWGQGRRHSDVQTGLNLDPFMIHETFLSLTESAFGSHPCRVVSVT